MEIQCGPVTIPLKIALRYGMLKSSTDDYGEYNNIHQALFQYTNSRSLVKEHKLPTRLTYDDTHN